MKFLCAGADLGEAKSRGFEIDGNKLFAVRLAARPTSTSIAARTGAWGWNGNPTGFSTRATA